MDAYINDKLDKRYNDMQGITKSKTIIDLALNSYMAEGNQDEQSGKTQLDATFRKYALSQIKVFIFAGHDSTATTMC